MGEGVRDGVGARPGANGDVLPVGEAQPGRLLKEGGARLAKAQGGRAGRGGCLKKNNNSLSTVFHLHILCIVCIVYYIEDYK